MTVELCAPCNGTGVMPAPCGRYEVERCASCHGTGVVSAGVSSPDLERPVVPREPMWSPYHDGGERK